MEKHMFIYIAAPSIRWPGSARLMFMSLPGQEMQGCSVSLATANQSRVVQVAEELDVCKLCN